MIVCKRCVMDETCGPFFETEDGGCNHCQAALSRLQNQVKLPRQGLQEIVGKIKAASKSEFDCVIGVSGGLDSSYLLVKAVELGLRPLAVHMDNNWNSSMASINLHNLLTKLDVPLVTVVTDWTTQKALQLAFLRSDVVDVELLYDNALHEVCYKVANEFKINSILGGANSATEGVEVPSSWVWKKFDGKNIRGIARNSLTNFAGYPIFGSFRWLWYSYVQGIKWYSILDYFPEYSRSAAMSFLIENFNYAVYGNKHFENVFTRFYQGHILPVKFGIDKRKPHLSSEILTGQISREEALQSLRRPHYQDENLLSLDKEYVGQKIGLSTSQLDDYLARNRKEHDDYPHDFFLKAVYPKLLRLRRTLLRITKHRSL